MRALAALMLALAAVAHADPVPREPSVTELQHAALRHADLAPGRVRALRRRLRTAALAPTLRLRAGKGSSDLTLTNLDDGSVHVDNGATWRIDAAAIWSLDRLVFDPSELGLEREGQRLAERRELLTTEVAQLYFERRRLEHSLAAGLAGGDEERAQAALRIEELTAILDGLTGGALSAPSRGAQ